MTGIENKKIEKIADEWTFVCSVHRDELIGIMKADGQKEFLIYQLKVMVKLYIMMLKLMKS